jgi:hypothetical protein
MLTVPLLLLLPPLLLLTAAAAAATAAAAAAAAARLTWCLWVRTRSSTWSSHATLQVRCNSMQHLYRLPTIQMLIRKLFHQHCQAS